MDTQEIIHRIQELKAANSAVILAHNYVRGEVQDIADFVGDSLALSIQAKKVHAPVIVFCGVRFMAETAKILSPDSEVLLPAPDAGCPMADMADPAEVEKYRKEHPDAVFVAYVNTTAAVKALVDICCTSANADKVLRTIPADREVLFLPDQNLGANTAAKLGRKLALWPGFCPTHNRIHPDEVRRIKAHEKVTADKGRLAVERGPIVYCAEGADNDGKAFGAVIPEGATFADGTVEIGGQSFPSLKSSNGMTLIPYCAWGNREPGNEMQTWFLSE